MPRPRLSDKQLFALDVTHVAWDDLSPIYGRALQPDLSGVAWADTSGLTMGRLVVLKEDMPNIGQFLRALKCDRAELLAKLDGCSVYAVDAKTLSEAVEKSRLE